MRVTRGGGGSAGLPYSFPILKAGKKCLNFGKNCLDCGQLWVTFLKELVKYDNSLLKCNL